jgi:hypothetical protein
VAGFDPQTLDLLDREREVRVVAPRADGSTTRTTLRLEPR